MNDLSFLAAASQGALPLSPASTMPILGPGQYAEIPFEVYLAQPSVSAGLLKTIIAECPRAAWFESWLNPARPASDDTAVSDAGSIAHGILLEGSTAGVEVIDPEEYPAKNGATPEGWTNPSIRAARDDARAAGRIPVLKPQMAVIENMVDSAQHFLYGLRESEPAIYAAFQPDGGESEQTLVWEEDGMLCRIRPDRISMDRRLIVDPKFSGVSVEPGEWSRKQMKPMGYRISAAFYRRGCQRMYGTEPDYVFLVIGQNAPHLCSLVGVDPAGLELGQMQVERAIRTWRDCVQRGYWPGYPSRVCYPEVKPWELAEEQERSGLDEHGIPYDPEVLFAEEAA